MTGYPWTAWLWWIGGAMLGLLGLWLLYWSLLHDRSKGRRRCPKCWYNMSGTDSMTCSECGRTAKREKKLYKTRHRWRWAFAAVLIGFLSVGSAITPKVQRDKWPSIIPTTVLILAVPWLEEPWKNEGGWKQDAYMELSDRLYDSDYEPRDIRDWQWRLLLRICLARIDAVTGGHGGGFGTASHYDDLLASAFRDGTLAKVGMIPPFFERFPVEIKWSLETPWPSGAPVHTFIEFSPSFSAPLDYYIGVDSAIAKSDSATIDLAPDVYYPIDDDDRMWRTVIVEQLPKGSYWLELRLEVSPFFPDSTATMPDEVRYFATLNEQLVVRGEIGDYLRPISDPQLTQQIVSSINELRFDFDFDPEGFPPTLWIHFSSKLGDVYDEMAVVLTLDVLHRGEVVATTHEQIEEQDPDQQTGERRFWVYFVLDSDSQALQAADPATDLWELRFRADPLHVLWWESSGDYWDGEFTITVDWNDPLQHIQMANYD